MDRGFSFQLFLIFGADDIFVAYIVVVAGLFWLDGWWKELVFFVPRCWAVERQAIPYFHDCWTPTFSYIRSLCVFFFSVFIVLIDYTVGLFEDIAFGCR